MNRLVSQNSINKIKYKKNQDVTGKEIQELLLQINYQCDTDLQNQIILKLALVLLSKNKWADMIINYNSLYETMSIYLNRGIPSQTAIIFNFILTMFNKYGDEGASRKDLYLYAQNMIRESGCLFALRNLFLSSMMQRDNWNALCHCLAEVCRGCQLNQTFCSDLIPVCIKHCHLANIDVIVFLQSLLERHEQNNNLFHINSGMTIFIRALLQNTQCLQLLNTVLECASVEFEDSILQANDVFQQLDNLSRYNKHSQIAQWASVIQYTRVKVLGSFVKKKQNVPKSNKTVNNTISDCDDTQHIINDMHEVINFNRKESRNRNDTRQQNLHTLIEIPRKYHPRQHCNRKIHVRTPKRAAEERINSFLMQSSIWNSNSFSRIHNILDHPDLRSHTLHDLPSKDFDAASTIEQYQHFRPAFQSTPTQRRTVPPLRKSDRHFQNRILKRNSNKNRSLGAKFLDAMNSSCASFVNTVKKVFKSKPSVEISVTADCTVKCGSFTEYFENKYANDKIDASDRSCVTCNDTNILTAKMQSDKHLRETVKKLKYGINLFGCDFKKISKTFWPNEQHMTPTVLYRLYRKLIVK